MSILIVRKQKKYCLFLFLCIGIFLSCTKTYYPKIESGSSNVPINELAGIYHGNDIILSELNGYENVVISGVVIANDETNNLPLKNSIILQDQFASIIVELKDGNDFQLGDLIDINTGSGTLSSINKSVVLKNISGTNDVTLNNSGSSVNIRSIVITELLNDFKKYRGTIIRIPGVKVADFHEGETFDGDKIISDGTGSLILHTEATASFANETMPESGDITGIPLYSEDGQLFEIILRSSDDFEEKDLPVYANGFPENFNTPLTKDTYEQGDLQLNSGVWDFNGATIAPKTAARPISDDGTKGIQFNQKDTRDLRVGMKFDVFKGASKVTLLYGRYANDGTSTFKLEYSQDQGETWSQIGDEILVDNFQAETATFDMDLNGQVRFRIVKPQNTNQGRSTFDDFTIYNNF